MDAFETNRADHNNRSRQSGRLFQTFRVIIGLLILLSSQLRGQNLGVRMGLNLPGMYERDSREVYSDNNRLKMSMHLGCVYSQSIVANLSVETGLMLTLKGVKSVDTWDNKQYTKKWSLVYLQMPVVGKYSLKLQKYSVYALAGPYFAWGLGGQIKYITDNGGDRDVDYEAIEWGNDATENDIKHADVGLHFGAGIRVNKVEFGAYYDWGLRNIAANTDFDRVLHNRVLGLTAIYYLKK